MYVCVTEEQELFRCYRQDIGDTMVSFEILGCLSLSECLILYGGIHLQICFTKYYIFGKSHKSSSIKKMVCICMLVYIYIYMFVCVI